ncbi:trypsin-like peptidase domain-containing protein [Aldersonia sp. NBC_00410]|uniref:trypsin-like peptidase domain-containing protein n=1 Tax=Aldersonia sp. NBC_00410 TaxID=2975954 RepID=UPI0022507F1B|nr:trypsin-like peptidase domain-containing protein [Aldersonia sp. NBC_00410]MCX5042115.1 trypsin-like peptidase domain-containing protein [Aldersonia sp. NBC_00410]
MSRRRSRTRIAALAALSLLAAGAGTACSADESGTAPDGLQAPNQLERAAALIRPAIVSLEMHITGYVFDEQGNIFNQGNPYEMEATCSGFVVNPDGWVATAGHCVDSGPEGFRDDFIQHAALEASASRPGVSAEDFYNFGVMNWRVEGFTPGSPLDVQIGVHPGGDPNAAALPARVVDFRPLGKGDVALVKVDAADMPSTDLATDPDVQVGDQVLAVGYPASTDLVTDQSAEPSNKEGAISSKKTQGSVPVYEISAAVSPGMSGGPTVDTAGKVLGVNSFTIAGESQPFNFIAPSSGLTELLDRNGVDSVLGPVDTTFRDGLDALYAGRYTDAIADFDKVLALAPEHAKAPELKTDATQLRDKYGDWGVPKSDDHLWYLIGGGALAAMVAMGLALLLVRKRRRPATAPAAPDPAITPRADDEPLTMLAPPMHAASPEPGQAGAESTTGVATLDRPTAPSRYCAACGAKAASTDRFCRGCGHEH